jgi:g-D-glutamyl-meso-diaminopimelate peptidase
LLADIGGLRRLGGRISYIGWTAAGRMIPCVHIGSAQGAQIIIQSAIHAREHITAKLAVEQAYYCLRRISLKPAGGIYFIPMVNADGVSLAQFGLDAVRSGARRSFLLQVNGAEGTDFTLWKANLNAVDLNVNFPADWGTGAQNVREPAPASYIGPAPASEPETRALMAFTRKVKPALTLSYHCKGEEIYWDFGQSGAVRQRDRETGQILADLTGYRLIDGALGSAGGYKDWCIQTPGIPAYTAEIISADAPYPVSYGLLPAEFVKNKDVPFEMLAAVGRAGESGSGALG